MAERIGVEIKGALLACLIALIIGMACSLTVFWTGLKETWLPYLANFTFILSVCAGACYSGWHRGNKGLFRGLATGTLFFFIVLLISLVLGPAGIGFGAVIKTLLFALAAGALGGILGVGLAL